ncbi:MAG: PEP-utilizing enzyme [Cyanobacteriota bacterium]
MAPATDPGWVLLFPHTAGLLVERGSVLSHVAIVAREMGLPMVTELVGIASALREGEWLELDGGSGTVRRVSGGAAAQAP